MPKYRLYADRGDPFANRPVGLRELGERFGCPRIEEVVDLVLAPAGLFHQLRTVMYDAKGKVVLFAGLYRPKGARAFDLADHGRLLALQPILRRWLVLAEAVGLAPMGDGGLVAAVESLGVPAALARRGEIVFANEPARLCEALGVDPFQVMDLVCRDSQLNISKAYLKPGYAFGGSCLPKDLRATVYLGKQRDVELPMHAGILSSNKVHVEHALSKVLSTGSRKVGFVGLSFKTGTDDLRESPLVTLAEQLVGKGVQLRVYDPEVMLSRLLGANRRFIDQHVPHLGELMRDNLAEVAAECEILVVGLATPEIFAALEEHVRPEHQVIDLVGLPANVRLKGRVEGLCW